MTRKIARAAPPPIRLSRIVLGYVLHPKSYVAAPGSQGSQNVRLRVPVTADDRPRAPKAADASRGRQPSLAMQWGESEMAYRSVKDGVT